MQKQSRAVQDTPAVAAAKSRHSQLYNQIALDHSLVSWCTERWWKLTT